MFLETASKGFYWRTLTPTNEMKRQSPPKLSMKIKPVQERLRKERRTSNSENELGIQHHSSSDTTSSGRLFNKFNKKRISRLNSDTQSSDVLQKIISEFELPTIIQGKEVKSLPAPSVDKSKSKITKTYPVTSYRMGTLYKKTQAETSIIKKNIQSSQNQRAHMNASLIKEQQKIVRTSPIKTKNFRTFSKALSETVPKRASKLKSYKIPKKVNAVQIQNHADQSKCINAHSQPNSENNVKKCEELKHQRNFVKPIHQQKKNENQKSENKNSKDNVTCKIKHKAKSNSSELKRNIKKCELKKSGTKETSVQKSVTKKKESKENKTLNFLKIKDGQASTVLIQNRSQSPTQPMMSPSECVETKKKPKFKRVSFESDGDDDDDEEFTLKNSHIKKCRPLMSDSEESNSDLQDQIDGENSNEYVTRDNISQNNVDKTPCERLDEPEMPNLSQNASDVDSECTDDLTYENCDIDYDNTVNLEDGDDCSDNEQNFSVDVASISTANFPVQSKFVQPFETSCSSLSMQKSNESDSLVSTNLHNSPARVSEKEIEEIVIDDDDEEEEDDDIKIIGIVSHPFTTINAVNRISKPSVEDLFKKSKATESKEMTQNLLEYVSSSNSDKEKELLKKITSRRVPVCCLCQGKTSLVYCQKCDQPVCSALCHIQHSRLC